MNHIYKTIFNKRTGQIAVVSEKTRNNCQSQQEKSVDPQTNKETPCTLTSPPFFKKQLTVAISILFSGVLSKISYAETYTGDRSTLKTSAQISTQFEQLLNQPNAEGVFGNPAQNTNGNRILTIDYENTTGTKPDFIISGYEYVDEGTNQQAIAANNNQIILQQGNIGGNIYAGLTHYTNRTPEIDCTINSTLCIDGAAIKIANDISSKRLTSSNNLVQIDERKPIQITGDIFSGYAGINLKYGDLSTAETVIYNNDTLPYKFSDSSIKINVNIRENNLNSNENKIEIHGEGNNLQNINAGYAGINLEYGDLSTANSYGYFYSNAFSSISPQRYLFDNNLDSKENKIEIHGEGNSLQNINAGHAGINLKYGNLNTAEAYTESEPNIYLITRTDSFNVVNSANAISSNNLNSNENKIEIHGEGNSLQNLNAGYAGINLESGDLSISEAITNSYTDANASADASINAYAADDLSIASNKLNANNNKIGVHGQNTLQNINSGHTEINVNIGDRHSGNSRLSAPMEYRFIRFWGDSFARTHLYNRDNYLNANANKIEIHGQNTLQDINAGHAVMNINAGDVSAANVYANTYSDINNMNVKSYAKHRISADSGKYYSTNNRVEVFGEDNSFQNINSGYAGINMKYGDVKSGLVIINGNSTSGEASFDVDFNNSILFAENNSIDLQGSSRISGDVITGKIDFNVKLGTLTDGYGNAVDNPLVYINGATPTGNNYITLNATQAYSTNNTISIDGAHTFTNPEAVIYGGYLTYNKDQQYFLADATGTPTDTLTYIRPETYDVFTGNTLNYSNSEAIKIKEIGNFQTYNFTLNPELANTGVAMIQANNVLLGATPDNVSDGSTTASDINVIGIQAGRTLLGGDKIIMLKATDNLVGLGESEDVNGVSQPSTTVAQQGISLKYDVKTDVDYANKEVTATILNNQPTVNPQLKPLLEGNLSGLMLLTRGADQLASLDDQHKRGLNPFIIASGQHSRYNSGSNIKSNSGLFTVGFSVYDDKTTWGMFIENGWDSYKTHNSFDNAADVNGKGHNRFNGYGVFANYQFDHNWYLDGTLRAGRLHTNFETSDLRNLATGEIASYQIKGNYYGASLKGGRDWAWNNKNTVDLSAKYSWVGTESQNLTVAGDPIHFDALNSHRILLNAENSYQYNPELSFISGLGYEQELAGTAKGTTYGIYDIDEASVKGGTGIVTAGLHYEPSQYKRLSIDLKGSGYFGKREGGSAFLKVDYKF